MTDSGAAPQVAAGEHWFEPLAEHMGAAYLRYSFTMGTDQEVDFLVDALGLQPGMRVLDVGCGPGRHGHALAARGLEVVGLDISRAFVDAANDAAGPTETYVRGDARAMTFDDEFDAAISLCQGAFGLSGPPVGRPGDPPSVFGADPYNLAADQAVLHGMRRAVRPGAPVAVSAFSAYFQVRWLEDHDTFDAATAVNHETTEVRDTHGTSMPADLWTTCYTPRELAMIAERAGLVVEHVWAVTPGEYARTPPDTAHHEHLLVARRPPAA